MDFNIMLKTHSGIEEYSLPYGKIGPLENDCIKQFDKRIADLVFLRLKEIEDPIELLFWSFRLCTWGHYDNMLPYTLYRCIIDEKFKHLYSNHPEWYDVFLCIGDCKDTSQK